MTTRPVRGVEIAEIDEAAVASYLAATPEFFDRHTQLLARIRLPDARGGGSTVSLLERQAEVLRERNRQLERKVTDFVEVSTGLPLRQAGTSTLKTVRIEGENFLGGQLVSIGTVSITNYSVAPDGTRISFTLPVMPQGDFAVKVADEFGRSSTSDFTVFFKTPPAFAATNPYSPGAVKLNTAATVTVRFLRAAPDPPLTRTYAVAAHSRHSIWVDAIEELAATDVSAVITSTADIAVERAMYLDAPDIPFFYSAATPPEWLEARLRGFQGSHPHVMLSCEGHAASTQLALRLMRFLPFRKPYWQYIPMLNHARRWLQPAPPPRPREAAPELEPAKLAPVVEEGEQFRGRRLGDEAVGVAAAQAEVEAPGADTLSPRPRSRSRPRDRGGGPRLSASRSLSRCLAVCRA